MIRLSDCQALLIILPLLGASIYEVVLKATASKTLNSQVCRHAAPSYPCGNRHGIISYELKFQGKLFNCKALCQSAGEAV